MQRQVKRKQFNVKYSPSRRLDCEVFTLKLPSHAIDDDKIYIFGAQEIARLNLNAFFFSFPQMWHDVQIDENHKEDRIFSINCLKLLLLFERIVKLEAKENYLSLLVAKVFLNECPNKCVVTFQGFSCFDF
jgi:hypothetical protein